MAAFSTTTTTCTNNRIWSQQRHHRLSTSNQPIKIHLNSYSGANCHGLDHFNCHASSVTSNSPSTTSSSWTDFAAKVSGEWDGFGADFTVEGNPIELPESVVPEAYREWEVKVFDWQTQCPTLAHCSDTTCLVYKTIKLLPTVGCEADAATVYTIEERNIDVDTSAFAYQSSSGCYVAVWGRGFEEKSKSSSIELEHCLVDPRDKEESRSRVRIIQVLGYDHQDSEYLRLKGIKVFVEQWYGPFRNGDQLGGCAIRDSAFAATQPLNASLVTGGVWQGLSTAVATFHTPHRNVNIQQLIEDELSVREPIRRRNKDDLILLPKKLWCSVQKLEDETYCEVGWLLDQGRAITSTCTFSSTTKELKEIALANETMVS
ncbi:hypothetical protein ACJIZ3_003402 [Penstemon smallii]|uniref:Uncharacterized protein n=1 Tax=Penstemon smallii TaxID=265156 RepID=A0ABD3U947_9LAMI